MAESVGYESVQIENIEDDDGLYRRLSPDQMYPDGTVNSNAFKSGGKPDASISVDLAKLTTAQDALARGGNRPGFAVGELFARLPRDLGFSVRHHPLPDDNAHSLIEGENDRKKCRLLAETTTVVIRS